MHVTFYYFLDHRRFQTQTLQSDISVRDSPSAADSADRETKAPHNNTYDMLLHPYRAFCFPNRVTFGNPFFAIGPTSIIKGFTPCFTCWYSQIEHGLTLPVCR